MERSFARGNPWFPREPPPRRAGALHLLAEPADAVSAEAGDREPPARQSRAPAATRASPNTCERSLASPATIGRGGVPERTNGAVLKTAGARKGARGFESHPRP